VPQELPQTGRFLLHESLDRGVASAEQLHVLKALIYERRIERRLAEQNGLVVAMRCCCCHALDWCGLVAAGEDGGQ